MPAVTVVIPTWNRSNLVGVAISSALAQTFVDLEVVVVDDGSKDGTEATVRQFEDSRVRYLRHETRRGGAAARNTGIESSRGRFIAFLDDDDEWLPEKIERQIDLFSSNGAEVGAVYTSYVVVDRATGAVLGRKIAQDRGDLSRVLLGRNVLGGTSSVVVRRDCFERTGLFDESLPSFQDYDLWIRLSKHFRFDCLEPVLLKYYVHRKTIWRDHDALERGIEIMIHKYGHEPSMRRNLSYTSLAVGGQLCGGGRCADGRRQFARAIRLYPFEFRHYLNWLLSFLGSGGYRAVKSAKDRLRSSARSRLVTGPPDGSR